MIHQYLQRKVLHIIEIQHTVLSLPDRKCLLKQLRGLYKTFDCRCHLFIGTLQLLPEIFLLQLPDSLVDISFSHILNNFFIFCLAGSKLFLLKTTNILCVILIIRHRRTLFQLFYIGPDRRLVFFRTILPAYFQRPSRLGQISLKHICHISLQLCYPVCCLLFINVHDPIQPVLRPWRTLGHIMYIQHQISGCTVISSGRKRIDHGNKISVFLCLRFCLRPLITLLQYLVQYFLLH